MTEDLGNRIIVKRLDSSLSDMLQRLIDSGEDPTEISRRICRYIINRNKKR